MKAIFTPLQSQLYGVSLAILTAVGSIYYEKLVFIFSIKTIVLLNLIGALFIFFIAYFFLAGNLKEDYHIFMGNRLSVLIWLILYIGSSCTSILWYIITKNQGVMIGAIYEIKYIVVLAIFYIIFGNNKFTVNTFVGLCLALMSIFFISKK